MIVGSRGYGPAHCLFHGSVSSYLERHARCPLVVVPPDAARDDENAPASTSGDGEVTARGAAVRTVVLRAREDVEMARQARSVLSR